MTDNPPAQQPRAPILFGLPEQPKGPSALDEAREEHRKRAERFGVQFVEPARARTDLRLEARRERVARPGFTTGIDFFSAEEEEKRRRRAAKFGLAAADDARGNGDAGRGFGPPPSSAAAAATLDPDDDPAELARRRARAERFGVPLAPPKPPQQRVGAHDGVMDVDALEAPADAAPDAEPRPEAVYLYGVDLLSTSDCLRYWSDYGPTFVEWINDSACVVLFADAQSARRAMHGTGVALPPPENAGAEHAEHAAPPAPAQEADAMDAAEAGEGAAPPPATAAAGAVVWFRGRDFVKAGTAVRLLYRGATQADRRDLAAPKPPSRHLWEAVGGGGPQVGSKRGHRGGGGGRQQYQQQQEQQQGRRRRRMDGSYEEVDMVDADGGDGGGGGGGGGDDDDEARRARGRGRGGRGRGGGGLDGDGEQQQQQQREGPRRVVRAKRRDGGEQQQQEALDWQARAPAEQLQQPQRQGRQGGGRRAQRGRGQSKAFSNSNRDGGAFLEIS